MPTINLCGKWEMLFSKEAPRKDMQLPKFNGAFAPENAVPGYFEDMVELFKTAPFYNDLVYNPEFKEIVYPISERVPDMTLKTIVGTFFYKKEVYIEAENKGKKFIFNCVGVQNRALLFVNGNFAGEHCGYSTPFSIDISNYIVAGENNTLIFVVSNHQAYNEDGDMISGCTSRAANRFTGGIMGDVTLKIKNVRYIEDIFVGAWNKNKDNFTVNATLNNAEHYTLKWQIFDNEKQLLCGESTANAFTIPRGELNLWSTKNPNLYILKVSLQIDGKIYDFKEQVFGIRLIEVDGLSLKLNDQPIYLRGICEHGYFAESVHPEANLEYYLKLVSHLKNLGFNHIRFHTFIPCTEYMQAADILGMVMHIESPNNTTVAEWEEIMCFVRKHPSVIIACCGNELLVDDKKIETLEKCAKITHEKAPNILFSPMSALRGVEYCWTEDDFGGNIVREPFRHNTKRFEKLQEFSDVFASFAQGRLSYSSNLKGSSDIIDSWANLYKKPRLSHEICIRGTYMDFSLEERYNGLRIGELPFMSSVREELTRIGLIDRADTYYKNSCLWQQTLRKMCIETARKCKTLAGYDFLGVTDHHWHTSGYHCGIMNEFYEMKPGETIENVLRYNGESILLSDVDYNRNHLEGENFNVKFLVSLFGGNALENATLKSYLQTTDGEKILEQSIFVNAKNGKVSDIGEVSFTLPNVDNPKCFTVVANIKDDNYSLENRWDIWVFPKVSEPDSTGIIYTDVLSKDIMTELSNGATVVFTGTNGLYSNRLGFDISLPGRSGGNLATVIEPHPLTNTIEHNGFCSWQFLELMDDATCLYFPTKLDIPFEPIIDVASAHQFPLRQAALVEFAVDKGKLLISTFNTAPSPSTDWWKQNLVNYAKSDNFNPKNKISLAQLLTLFSDGDFVRAAKNDNFAGNANDVTMKKK